MHSREIAQLDAGINSLIAGHPLEGLSNNPHLLPMIEIACQLHLTPRPEFRARLYSDLVAQAALPPARRGVVDASPELPTLANLPSRATRDSVLPSLFSSGMNMLPVSGSHLAFSFALHVAALAIVFTSGWWMVQNRALVRTQIANRFSGTVDYILSPSHGEIHGGGGGGTHDKMPASRGSAPRFAEQQRTPPTVIVVNQPPKLPVESTVVGPPDVKLPQLGQIGDPTAAILNPPSNGMGSGGGIGTGQSGGVGSGYGAGVGPGYGGGMGGGIYHVGGGVSSPRPVYDPDPEYSEQARKAKYQGSVLLRAIVGPDGRPRDLHIARTLGMGLDEKAIEAVRKWRFEPALKDGRPVAVEIGIEVVFRLY